jgi:hypothetical protein
MPTEIYEDNAFVPSFKVDADLQSTETMEFDTTSRKVEGKGIIANYIASKPDRYSVEGVVTAMTVDPDPPEAEKLVNAKTRLKQLAAKKKIVLVLTEMDAVYLAINRVEIAKGVSDGYSFKARIGFIEIETTTVGTTQIPASRLRAKVKKRAATGKKGGAAKPSAPGGKDKTVTLQALNVIGFLR